MNELTARVEALLHSPPVRTRALSGGCVGDVRHLTLADGRDVVAKIGHGPASGLALEGFMLAYLAEHSSLPVPKVRHAEDTLLLMDYIAGGDAISPAAEENAADHLAALHGVSAPHFGFERDTVIAALPQPNPKTLSWRDFFRDQRLMYMARDAARVGHLPEATLARLEKLCTQLDRWLPPHSVPSLVHGDMWTGNVLVRGRKIAGFVDPAIYFADPEIELAFATLFGTFGDSFFRRYGEHRPLRPGFFEERRNLYNLYPLLVHVRLFGGSYVTSVERTLKRFGF